MSPKLLDRKNEAARRGDAPGDDSQGRGGHPACHLYAGMASAALRSWQLVAGQTLALQGWRGHAWVTMEGDSQDYVLAPDSHLRFAGPGLLVVETLEESTLYDWQDLG